MRYLLLLLFMLSSVTGCSQPDPERFGTVTLPDGFVILAELARTPMEQARGLMFRKDLPLDQGMLFVYPEPAVRGIWMKNCFFALDLIWLSGDGKILYIEENAPPCDLPEQDCPSYTPFLMCQYILELKAGAVEAHGLAVGQQLLLNIDGKSIPPASSHP